MPRRIILHAGFHKTGTATVQATLRENRVAMKKHIAIRLQWHMRDLVAATRSYSTGRDPSDLIKAQEHFTTLMDELPKMPRRTLILSSAELCGHMPGRGALMEYSAAPVLLYAFWEIAHQRYPEAEILIYLTTRAPEAWLTSAYWENVQSSDMTLDHDTFCANYTAAANLAKAASEIAARVPCPVHTTALEDCSDLPHGPAEPLLDLCDLPLTLRTELIPQPNANKRLPEHVLKALLTANQTHNDHAARSDAKRVILSAMQHS